ncbi:transglutaminase-like putative cysteine protease [Neorhizobium sp. R1-B]|uniref:transglutaminase family protein n=1 Tax=unclassified Neorhizobium TaxID=2629175 RepID=UPI001043B3E2|nr:MULTISPECIES: transglutaminase family protein [unclassified Neorhizobium]TCV74523.1 transglutaminase-like putative cysteine protease [Neorhizobium sp. S3-V5DH]TDX87709.1 transglutaminase-like putative cysteine protease [Neorhizobium sp. R1-B]
MRLKISHTTEYLYDQPVPYSLQRLRLTPVDGPTQKVINWAITVDGAKVEAGYADQYGNRIELVSAEGTEHTIRISASGEVETSDKAGVFGPHQGFCPLWLFLRETPRTKAGKLIKGLAKSLTGDSELARMHALMEAIHGTVAYTPGTTDTETTAEEALEAKTGVCQDHAHIFVSAARLLDIPARYVSGYLLMEGTIEQVATHAWAEVHLPGLGWVGFDAANNICPDDRYVRIASGLCYRDCAPVSGMRLGLAGENLKVSLTVAPSQTQSQSQNGQSQSQTQG